jgi:hypothetical protein
MGLWVRKQTVVTVKVRRALGAHQADILEGLSGESGIGCSRHRNLILLKVVVSCWWMLGGHVHPLVGSFPLQRCIVERGQRKKSLLSLGRARVVRRKLQLMGVTREAELAVIMWHSSSKCLQSMESTQWHPCLYWFKQGKNAKALAWLYFISIYFLIIFRK